MFNGNLKNHCDTCFATSAGVIPFKGLDGQVRIGSQNTPAFKSRYCPLHLPMTGKLLGDSESSSSRSSSEHQIALMNNSNINFISGTRIYMVHIRYVVPYSCYCKVCTPAAHFN